MGAVSSAGRPGRAPRLRSFLPRVLVNIVAVPVAYILIRPRLGSDAAALALVGTIPVVWTIAFFAVRRHIDPIGAFAVLSFGIALLVSALAGGSALPLELHWEFVLTGLLGLAFLVSAAVRKPLLPLLVERLHGEALPAGRRMTVPTVIIGATLLAGALVHVILALTLPVRSYLVVSRLAGWGIYGVGLAILLLRRRRTRPAS